MYIEYRYISAGHLPSMWFPSCHWQVLVLSQQAVQYSSVHCHWIMQG